MLYKNLVALSVLAALGGCSSFASNEQQAVNAIASDMDISYQVLTNHGADEGLACKALEAEWASCNKVNMTLANQGGDINSKDWAIYFHSIRLVLDLGNDQFKVTRITGDLHKLEPTEKFQGFKANEDVVIPMVAEYWQLFETDFMPGAFVTAPNSEPRIIASLNTEDTASFVSGLEGEKLKRTKGDNNVFATAITRFEKNQDVEVEDVSSSILPTPLSIQQGEGKATLSEGVSFAELTVSEDQLTAINARAKLLGLDTAGQYPVSSKISPESFKGDMAVSGAYELEITPDQTNIVAFDEAGAFYAVQSLFSLVDVQSDLALPIVKVTDAPRFEYRGVMVDVARNFHTKEAILATLDQMAAYKMNKLHLHLTDDEGWRLEIPGLPELTDIGANRCFDVSEKSCLLPQLGSGPEANNFGSGYFSTDDYVEILKYAKARSIEVIPEIDMPAHARAAVVSMEARYDSLMAAGNEEAANEFRLTDPQDTSNVTTVQFYDKLSFINPCMDSSKRFVDKVITEVAAMHNAAGMPLSTWHFGGDEAKNIKLGAGFEDVNTAEPTAWKGNLDLSKQDKPFAKSPQCQTLVNSGVVSDFGHLPSHFAEQVSQMAADKGIPNFQAWQDGLKYSEGESAFATENTRVNFWDVLYWGGTASVYDWSKKGYDVIVSNPDYVYMDMPYEVDPKERGYYWATRATDTRKMFGFAPENMPQNAETSVDRDGNPFTGKGEVDAKPFYGLSAQLWSETVRNDEQYEYMVFPRVLAAAERAWHRADWENDYKVGVEYSQSTNLVDKDARNEDWNRFANVLGQRELAKLELAGINYRLPVPGAIITDGVLAMNVQFPGVSLQYSTDNGNTWLDYSESKQPTAEGNVLVRSVSATGDRTGRVTKVQ